MYRQRQKACALRKKITILTRFLKILNPLKVHIVMMKKVFLLALILCWGSALTEANQKPQAVKVTYRQMVNGQETRRGGSFILEASPEVSVARADRRGEPLLPQTPEEKEILDFQARNAFQTARLAKGNAFHVKTPFSEFPPLTLTGERQTILGYSCEKATASLRSNAIEIWFTRDVPCRGTPQMAYGIPDGLVLKIVRNNNFEIMADSVIALTKDQAPFIPADLGDPVDQALYRHLITENYITTIDIFTDEQISWGNTFDNPQGEFLNQTYKYAGGTVILKKVKLPGTRAGDQLFIELTQYSKGDAYDRTGTVFVIPTGKQRNFLNALTKGIDQVPFFTARNGKSYQGMTATPGYDPAVELLRFFTPFGVRHFNEQVKVYGQTWENAAFYKQEITDLIPLLRGEVWIGAFIGNYDKGGHSVTLQLKYYPGSQTVSERTEPAAFAMPLFNTLNIMEMAGQNYGTLFDTDSLTVEFEIPEGVKNLKLRYLTTGHGGWGGGDEFNPKENRIIIDNQVVYSFTPWRTDCGTWRKYNPSSGNFWNGLTSSDYSRSGWCPGSATDPVFIPLDDLQPGKHVMKVAIPQGQPEGGSFSAWCVSGVLTGNY